MEYVRQIISYLDVFSVCLEWTVLTMLEEIRSAIDQINQSKVRDVKEIRKPDLQVEIPVNSIEELQELSSSMDSETEEQLVYLLSLIANL